MIKIGSIVEYLYNTGIVVNIRKSECTVWIWKENSSHLEITSPDRITETGRSIDMDCIMSVSRADYSETQIQNAIKIAEDVSPDILTKLTYLAISHILPDGSRKEDAPEYMRIQDIINFINENYGTRYKTGSRETIRKQAIKELLERKLIIDNGFPKQSPRYGYKLSCTKEGKGGG